MKAQTLKQIYATILHDDSVSLAQFEEIVNQLKNYNGHSTIQTTSLTPKRGRPKGSKNKGKGLDEVFSQPNKRHD